MRKEELLAECLSRGIVYEDKNREQMFRDIKAYVQIAAQMPQEAAEAPNRNLLHRRAWRLDGCGQLGQWQKLRRRRQKKASRSGRRRHRRRQRRRR